MLSTPLICCSMGVATDCSTVCASAPTYVVCTCTSGGAIDGNNETGRLTSVMAPTMTVSSAITIATIGRLTKNLDMSPLRRCRLVLDRVDDGAVADLQQSFDNHTLAGLHAFGHDPQRADAVADADGPDGHLVGAVDDGNLVA